MFFNGKVLCPLHFILIYFIFSSNSLLLTHHDLHMQLKILRLVQDLFQLVSKLTWNDSAVISFVECLSSIIVKSDVNFPHDFPLNTTSMIELLPSIIDLFDQLIQLISIDESKSNCSFLFN